MGNALKASPIGVKDDFSLHWEKLIAGNSVGREVNGPRKISGFHRFFEMRRSVNGEGRSGHRLQIVFRSIKWNRTKPPLFAVGSYEYRICRALGKDQPSSNDVYALQEERLIEAHYLRRCVLY
jgi:hypothetical protein